MIFFADTCRTIEHQIQIQYILSFKMIPKPPLPFIAVLRKLSNQQACLIILLNKIEFQKILNLKQLNCKMEKSDFSTRKKHFKGKLYKIIVD